MFNNIEEKNIEEEKHIHIEDDNTKAVKTGINKVIIWCIISVVVIIGIIIVLIFVLKKKNTNKKL